MDTVSDPSDAQHVADPGQSREPKAVRRGNIATRWGGDPAILDRGYVGVPTLFLERHASLKPYALNPAEALFVICLMAHKWDERAPYPSYRRLAQWMGKTPSYMRKIARQLEIKGMLQRRARIGATNEFDLSPLFSKIVGTGRPRKVPKKPRHRRPQLRRGSRR